MQRDGRRDEARSIEQRRSRPPAVRAVRVAVEQREHADQRRAHRERRPQRRTPPPRPAPPPMPAMPISTQGSATPLDAQHRANRHHHREHQRQKPHRRPAELRSPEADRHHRQHMIEAGERMRQPVGEAIGDDRRMGERRGAQADGRDGGRAESEAWRRAAHGVPHGRTMRSGMRLSILLTGSSRFQSTSMTTAPPSTVAG